MKKIILTLFIMLLPFNAMAGDDDNLFQGLWQEFIEDDYEDIKSQFSAKLVVDLESEHRHNSTRRQDEYNDTFGTVRFAPRIKLGKNLSLNGNIRLSRVSSQHAADRRNTLPNGGGDRFFEENGITARELVINYTKDDLSLIAGKFSPAFGTAWRWGRGIWARDVAENYRQLEKIGVGTIYKAGDYHKTGRYHFGFSAFTNDRKNLDNSLMNKRDSDQKSDARPGDTRSLESYVASVDIKFDFEENEKLTYHFSYLNLAVNETASQVTPTKIDDQKGFAAALNYRYPINDNFLLDTLVEYVDMKNVNGDSDITEKYLNASFVAEFYDNWNITLASGQRKNIEIDQNGFDEQLFEGSFGYKMKKTRFFDQLLLQIGYKSLRTNYKTSIIENNSYGLLVRYIKSF